jgi:ABC-type phosphate transport system permease subunit
MRVPILQSVAGVVLLFAGAWPYARHGDAVGLLLIIVGAICLTVGSVTIAIKQALRDEWKRRNSEQHQPVLGIE